MRLRALQVLMLALLLLGSAGARAATEGPDQAIRDTTERVRLLIQANRAAYEADSARFHREMEAQLLPRFDTRYIGQLVLGPHWREASEAQRERFIEAFKSHLVRSYAGALLEHADSVEFGWRPARMAAGATEASVGVDLIRQQGPPVPLVLAVRRVGTEWKVYDITVEGISLATNYRSQFSGIIRKQGLEALIARLERRAGSVGRASGAP